MKKSFLTIVSLLAISLVPSKAFAADTTNLQTTLMNYLPYILIGGAVILLISIAGILLSKKKEKKEEVTIPEVAPVVVTTENTDAISTPVEVPPVETASAPVQAVNMDEISNNLYSPTVVSKPTIQETMESSITPEDQPISQPTFTESSAPATQNEQVTDLQDILQGEASASPMGPVTDHVAEEAPAITPTPMETPMPVETTPMPDLQQFINNQVAEVPPMTTPETPAQAMDNSVPTPTTPGIV